MKRTRDGVTSSDIYVTGGCICYTGQGYSPCNCPSAVEVTEEELARKADWSPMDVAKFLRRELNGRYVKWGAYTVAGGCVKTSDCGTLLRKWEKFSSALVDFGQNAPATAFYLNGDFRYWHKADIGTVLGQFDVWEGVCRSTVSSAVFIVPEQKMLWCFDEANRPDAWETLTEADGPFAPVRVSKE